MPKVQRYYVKFKTDSLNIESISRFKLEADSEHTTLPVASWDLVEPFFTLNKNPNEYYPLIQKKIVTGFRRRDLYQSDVVKNSEEPVVRSLRSGENFIADCKILVESTADKVTLTYDPNYFDVISNQTNIERLTLSQDRVYNMYITRKGNPFEIFATYETTLKPLLKGQSISLSYAGEEDISVYAIAKD
jgi:hypothetical protein